MFNFNCNSQLKDLCSILNTIFQFFLMNCLKVCQLAATVQKDKIAFVSRRLIKVTLKTGTCTTVVEVITAGYFTNREHVAAPHARPATCLSSPLALRVGRTP